jgi:hypothetical protein
MLLREFRKLARIFGFDWFCSGFDLSQSGLIWVVTNGTKDLSRDREGAGTVMVAP